MSTFEAPAVDGAILRRIHDMLVDAMAEAGRILAGAGASPEEMLNMTVPFLPLMRLLRDALEPQAGGALARGVGASTEAARADGSRLVRKPPDDAAPPAAEGAQLEPDRLGGRSFPPSPKEIEERFLDRGSPASNVVSILRRR
jgi:hypothetical protein